MKLTANYRPRLITVKGEMVIKDEDNRIISSDWREVTIDMEDIRKKMFIEELLNYFNL